MRTTPSRAAARSRSSPSITSREYSISPSVYAVNSAPGGSVNVQSVAPIVSTMPSGTPSLGSSDTTPHGSASSGAGWPADAYVTVPSRGSTIPNIAVTITGFARMFTIVFARSSTSDGELGLRAAARNAWRTSPMTIAARSPWPATSPIENAMRPSGKRNASYQSPPTIASCAPGKYAASNASRSSTGKRSGSSARCSVSATWCSRAYTCAASTDTATRNASSDHKSSPLAASLATAAPQMRMTPRCLPRATRAKSCAPAPSRPACASVVRISPSSTSTEKPSAKPGTISRPTAASV